MNAKWYHYLAWFFGALFLTNTIPHFVMGVTGHPFQSPFASPPGQGLSPALTNVLWGYGNLVVGYLLTLRVGNFQLRRTPDALVFGAGVLAMGLLLAMSFARFYAGT